MTGAPASCSFLAHQNVGISNGHLERQQAHPKHPNANKRQRGELVRSTASFEGGIAACDRAPRETFDPQKPTGFCGLGFAVAWVNPQWSDEFPPRGSWTLKLLHV